MIRPGRKVKPPAMIKAPNTSVLMVRLCLVTLCLWADAFVSGARVIKGSVLFAWVSLTGVARYCRGQGRDVLVMLDGVDVPVSRSFRAITKDARLF